MLRFRVSLALGLDLGQECIQEVCLTDKPLCTAGRVFSIKAEDEILIKRCHCRSLIGWYGTGNSLHFLSNVA